MRSPSTAIAKPEPPAKSPVFLVRLIIVDGVLLLLGAAVHLTATPPLRTGLTHLLSPETHRRIAPLFLSEHIATGAFLFLFGVLALYCAPSIRKGVPWAWMVCFLNAIALLSAPISLVIFSPRSDFRTTSFLFPVFLMGFVSLSMIVGLLYCRTDFTQ